MHLPIKELEDKKLIAIEGEPGSGKSTLANYLAKQLNAIVISIDDYYLPFEKRTKNSFVRGGNNIDFSRLIKEVINPHLNNESIKKKSYSCQTRKYSESETIEYKPILIIEGSYVLREELIYYFDYKILLEVNHSLQEKRLIGRVNYPDFLSKWIPLSRDFIKEDLVKDKVDYIIKDLNINE